MKLGSNRLLTRDNLRSISKEEENPSKTVDIGCMRVVGGAQSGIQ